MPRYRCRDCGRGFSSHTFRAAYRQKKPYLNAEIFKWYSSGTTQRRMALVMGVNRKTVVRKFLFLALQAKQAHQKRLASGALKSGYVQFDEMETFEHTRLKPLSIALAVRAGTGEILDAQVATMACKGKLASVSVAKYGWRPDTRKQAASRALLTVALVSRPELRIFTDKKSSYPRLVKTILPHAKHHRLERFKKSLPPRRPNPHDPLFRLNHACAKIRHDLSRMGRKVWVTTKKADRLQAHLDLYIAFNNKYAFTA